MRRAVAAVLLLLAQAVAGQQFEQLMKEGDDAHLLGKTKKAVSRYQAAVDAATRPEQRVDAFLALAEAVRGGWANVNLDAATAVQVDTAYRRALTEAVGKTSLKTHNDYAVFLLDRGDVLNALEVFTEGEKDLASVEPETASFYLYNFALAHARAGLLDEALAKYRSAMERGPSYAAAKVTFSLVKGFPSERAAHEAMALIELLVERDRLTQAYDFIKAAMEMEPWHAHSAEMERLIELFVRWMMRATNVDDLSIRLEWMPRLKLLAAGIDGSAREKLAQLLLVYEGDLPMSFDANFEEIFARWNTPEERRNLSLLLKNAALWMNTGEEQRQGAARYIASWKLDRTNLDSMALLASHLMDWKDVDSEKLFDRMIDELFVRNGEPPASADIWPRLRLHSTLGAIFSLREQWGPDSNPRTAAFHHAAVLRDYQTLRGQNKAPILPGVHADLAGVYEHTGEKAKAWEQYVLAADASLKTGKADAAAKMIEKGEALDYQPDEKEKAWMLEVRTAVNAVRQPGPGEGINR